MYNHAKRVIFKLVLRAKHGKCYREFCKEEGKNDYCA